MWKRVSCTKKRTTTFHTHTQGSGRHGVCVWGGGGGPSNHLKLGIILGTCSELRHDDAFRQKKMVLMIDQGAEALFYCHTRAPRTGVVTAMQSTRRVTWGKAACVSQRTLRFLPLNLRSAVFSRPMEELTFSTRPLKIAALSNKGELRG